MKERLGIFVIAAIFTCAAAFVFQNSPTHARAKAHAAKAHAESSAGGQKTMAEGKTSVPLNDSDKEFVMKAAKAGTAEVELGNLALTKAENDEVKKFAQRMIDDHSKANTELTQLAQSRSVIVPADSDVKMDAEFKAINDKLSALSGAEFDREYMHHMVMDHQQAVALFERQAKSKNNDDNLEKWAEKTLPTLKDHLRMAKDIAKKVGAGHKAPKADSNMKPNK